MTEKRKVLGRGLETLLPSRAATQPPVPAAAADVPSSAPSSGFGEAVRHIPLDLIDQNPYQTRTHVEESALNELSDSIKATGVLQPVTVRPGAEGRFVLIAGARRCLASQRAGKNSIPAIVRHVSNEQAMEMTIIENLQREDLNPMEQARAFERLSSEFGLTQEQIAQRTGKDRSSIANFLRLLRLPNDIQTMVMEDKLTFGHAKALMSVGVTAYMLDLARRTIDESLSVRQLEKEVAAFLNPPPEQEPKRERPVDPNVREAEYKLRSALGLKVTVNDRQGRGKVVIQYANLDEFDRILEIISKP
jgi:ParB family chromosome partitioning protein